MRMTPEASAGRTSAASPNVWPEALAAGGRTCGRFAAGAWFSVVSGGVGRRGRLPTCMEIAAVAERDHLLGERLDRLRLRLGRLDPAVLDQRAGEVRVQRLPVRRVAAELLPRAMVPHQWFLR